MISKIRLLPPLAMPMTSALSIRLLSLFKNNNYNVVASYSKPFFQRHYVKALIGQ